MKINFTNATYRELLKLVYLGGFIKNGLKIISEKESDPSAKAVQAVYAAAGQMGCEKWIEYDAELKEYFETPDLEQELAATVSEYEEDVFWDELINRLARRDAVSEVGSVERLKDMPDEEYYKVFDRYLKKYDEEFSLNGLKRLIIAG